MNIEHVLLIFFFCKYPDGEAEDASRQQAFETARDDIKLNYCRNTKISEKFNFGKLIIRIFLMF
jgi:hypothetical protein